MANAQTKHNHFKWQTIADLSEIQEPADHYGLAGAFSGVHNNVLIMAGGANFPTKMPWKGGQKVYWDNIYILEKEGDNNWKWFNNTFKLPVPAAYGVSVSTPYGLVCAGGENAEGALKSTVLLKWDPLKKEIQIKDLPDLPVAISNASAAVIGTSVYFAGGENKNGPLNTFYKIDLVQASPVWEDLPNLPYPVSYASAVAQSDGLDECFYLIGGRKKESDGISTTYSSVLQYNPVTRKWKEKNPISNNKQPVSLSAGTAIAKGANYILLFGGSAQQPLKRLEEIGKRLSENISADIKAKLLEERDTLLANHQGFDRGVYLYNTITDTWAIYDEIPHLSQVTTSIFRWGNQIIIPSGEVKPGLRTPSIYSLELAKNTYFSVIDFIVVVICFLLMTVARFFVTKNQNSTEDYFKGGKRIPKWAAGLSIFGAKLSAITFMGIPAKTFGTDWTYFFLLMSIIMVMPVVIKFFIPFYRKLNVTSAYEYLERRFNYLSRLIAASLYILLQLGRMSIVIMLPSIALTLVTGINVYACVLLIGIISIFFTVKGGIEAVIWVEVIQVIILFTGALITLIYIPIQLNNSPAESLAILSQSEKLKVFDMAFDFTKPTFWVVVLGGIAMNLITYGTDQTVVQRYLTTKDEKSSVASLKLGAWLTLPSTLVFFSIGTLLYLFFKENPSEVNVSLDNQDNIFPWYIVSQLPAGLAGLLIAGIFAAAMSSTEASMNSVATILTTDFYKKLYPAASDKRLLFFARVITVTLGVSVTILALIMAHYGVGSLWDKFNTIIGLFTGAIGGAFLLGIFSKHANGYGVALGMLFSGILQILLQQFTSLNFLMYAFSGGLSCVVFGYIFSYFFKQEGDLTMTYAAIKNNPKVIVQKAETTL